MIAADGDVVTNGSVDANGGVTAGGDVIAAGTFAGTRMSLANDIIQRGGDTMTQTSVLGLYSSVAD